MSRSDFSSSVSRDRSACEVPRYRSWREAVKDAVRDPIELCRLVKVPPQTSDGAALSAREFPVFVPREYIARMRLGDAGDPLLRQVLPLADEQSHPDGYGSDPVGDAAAVRGPGLLQKYRSRVLMVTTGACAVHCRYCFRRHFPYADTPRSADQWDWAVAEIAADASLTEVILSGGDPLMLADSLLQELARRIAAVPHVRRLRVHTRLPLLIANRITDDLLAWLAGTRLTSIVVIHANHPNELDPSVAAALARLADAGVQLLNQSVLLKGVNDDADVLAELSERLLDMRVMPYYLHQLDRVAGAAHFEVSESRGRRIMAELRSRLPGYAVPRYVREVAGAAHKIALG